MMDRSETTLVSAYEVYRKQWATNADVSDEALRGAEEELIGIPATSLAGIEAKLRVVLDILVPGRWASNEALMPLGTPLVERREIDDFADRLLFRVAQDVARFAGRRP